MLKNNNNLIFKDIYVSSKLDKLFYKYEFDFKENNNILLLYLKPKISFIELFYFINNLRINSDISTLVRIYRKDNIINILNHWDINHMKDFSQYPLYKKWDLDYCFDLILGYRNKEYELYRKIVIEIYGNLNNDDVIYYIRLNYSNTIEVKNLYIPLYKNKDEIMKTLMNNRI